MKYYSNALKIVSVLLILSAILVPVTTASAALRICRTDPLVYFAGGNKLSITASISADPSAITSIVYTVHAPVGSRVMQVVHTAGGLGLEETLEVVADQPAGVYNVDTIVYTVTKGIDVKTTTMLMIGITTSASGHSYEHLITTIKAPVSTSLYYRAGHY